MSGTVHVRLLEELRTRSLGPPEIPATPTDLPIMGRITFLKRLELVQPLVIAAYRSSIARSLLAIVLGVIVLFIAVGHMLKAGFALDRFTAATLGISVLLLVIGIEGAPGGTSFMKVQTEAGFYGDEQCCFGERNARIRKRYQEWMAGFKPCPILRSGELCTVMPFLWNPNRCANLTYERIWIEAEDKERFACDWVFPKSGFDPTRPVVLLLPGLAPSKHWTITGGFIGDAAWHLCTRLGMTVVIVIARGTMDTEVREHLFHGARVEDLRKAITVTEDVICSHLKVERGSSSAPRVFAVGFSMGAIILGNYCGKYGRDTRLCGAVHFSGIYDAVANMKFEYSRKTWQAYLCYSLKTVFLTSRIFREAIKRGVNMERILSRHVGSVVDFDDEFVAVYNGYNGVKDYYRDLSLAAEEKWKCVSVPLLAICARDDPITHCDALRARELSTGNGNLLFLITERGGHVGWPWGHKPWQHGFDFMNLAIGVFINAVLNEQSDVYCPGVLGGTAPGNSET